MRKQVSIDANIGEMSLSEWVTIHSTILRGVDDDKFDNVVSKLTNLSIKEINDLTIESYTELSKTITEILEDNMIADKEFHIHNKLYYNQTFDELRNTLTLDEYISIALAMSNLKRSDLYIPHIIACICRPLKNDLNEEFNMCLKEPIPFDAAFVEIRKEKFLKHTKIRNVILSLQAFNQYQRHIIPILTGLSEEELEGYQSPTDAFESSMDPIYEWIAVIDRLTNGDITKDEIIYKKNYLEILMRMSYWKARDKKIEVKNFKNKHKK